MKTKIQPGTSGAGSPASRLCRLGTISFLLAAALPPLAAQNRLYVQGNDENYHVVCKVGGGRPYIMENGRAVATNGDRFALRKVEEYLPILITVSDEQASSTSMHLAATDDYHNNQFHYKARFESAVACEDVFIALELEISNVGKRIYVYEIGNLKPQTPRLLDVNLPMGQYLGAGQIVVHLFVAGAEVLQSKMSAEYREEQLDRMVMKRVATLKESAPKPFFGSMPAYPAALRESGLKGEATVTMRITAQGRVLDPVVDRTSEPPFGEAALAAVRQWRFLPQVAGGQPVETKVSIPFVFDPPPPAGTGKG